MLRNQTGFSALEGLLAVAIVGIVALAGYAVYQREIKSAVTVTSQVSIAVPKTFSVQSFLGYATNYATIHYKDRLAKVSKDNTNLSYKVNYTNDNKFSFTVPGEYFVPYMQAHVPVSASSPNKSELSKQADKDLNEYFDVLVNQLKAYPLSSQFSTPSQNTSSSGTATDYRYFTFTYASVDCTLSLKTPSTVSGYVNVPHGIAGVCGHATLIQKDAPVAGMLIEAIKANPESHKLGYNIGRVNVTASPVAGYERDLGTPPDAMDNNGTEGPYLLKFYHKIGSKWQFLTNTDLYATVKDYTVNSDVANAFAGERTSDGSVVPTP